MVAPKCRLEVWKPKIRIVNADGTLAGLYEPDRWVACETHENIDTNQRRGNALESTSISDRVFEPMIATMRVTNRPQDFKSYDADVYKHLYKDSDGAPIPNYSTPSYPGTLSGGQVYLRKRWGAFTNFFYEFQHVRIVDLETHLVLFAGRLTKITKRYEDGNGSIVQLEARDALNDIANITTSALVKSATFSTSHRRSDLVKYMLNLATDYEGNQPTGGPGVNVTIDSDDISTITNSSSGVLTNVDIGTNDVINQYSRFERSAQAFREPIKWNAEMTGTKHVLAEIGRWAMLDPHNSNTSERAFGYDLFVDANYGKKNLMATIGPGVTDFNAPHFNYFKRGNRLSAAGGAGQDAAVYGLTVKYPTITTAARVGAIAINVGELAESINAAVTTFEITNTGIIPGIQIQIGSEYMYVKGVFPDEEGLSGNDELEVIRGFASTAADAHDTNDVIINPRSAQTIMQRGFNFEDSKEDLYTEAVLTWNSAKDNLNTSGVQESTAPHFSRKRFEIMYATEVSGLFTWVGKNITADFQSSSALSTTAEKVDAYNVANGGGIGTIQQASVARIQYQSHSTLTGSTNFAYILLSDIQDSFPSTTYDSGNDDYIYLKGQSSNATCRVNIKAGLTEAHEGRPSKVWGTHRVLDMGQMSDEDPTDLRTEIAARLAQATTGLRQGSYAFSKAPYYWWDGLVRSVATANAGVSFGQDITVKNVNGSAAINITNFGVREGMLVHKMTANHAAIAQAGGLDVYGYIGDMQDSQTIAVQLEVRNNLGNTTISTFSVGDPIRIIIPVRAGTEVFVDNVIAEIYGEHIVSQFQYNEDPIPETRIISVGKNETRLGGGHRVKGLISSIAQTALGVKEKSKIFQPPALGSLFGGLTVTMPKGDEAHTALKATWSDGSLHLVDGRVFNFAASSTANNMFGLDGDMVAGTSYIVYLDPEGENLGPEGVIHLYTKLVSAYTRDTDNIPIFHITGTNTTGVTKPIIRLQPNIWLTSTIPLTNEASAHIDPATILAPLIADLAITNAKLDDLSVSGVKVVHETLVEHHYSEGSVTSSVITNGTISGKTFINTGLEFDTSGYLRTTDKDTYADTTAGFWLGLDSGTHKLNIGSAANYMKWDGSALNIKGTIILSDGTTEADIKNSEVDATDLGTKVAGLTLSSSQMNFGSGNHGNADTAFYVNSNGNFSLGAGLVWTNSSATLAIAGTLTLAGTSGSIVLGADGLAFGATAETTARSINWRHNPSSGEESYTTLYRGNQAGIATGRALILVASGSGATAANSPLMSLVNIELLSTKLVISSAGAGFTDSVGSITGPNAFLQTISSSGSGVHTKLATEAAIIAYVAANAGIGLSDNITWTGIHKFDHSGGILLKVGTQTSLPPDGYVRLNAWRLSAGTVRLTVYDEDSNLSILSDDSHSASGGGGGSGDITAVTTTGAITGGAQSGTAIISHSTDAPYKHIPADGTSGQILENTGSGTAGWVSATAHGTHGGSGGSHDHSSSYSFTGNSITAVGNITVVDLISSGVIKGADGSASAPTHTFSGSTDAGMWYGSGSGGTGVGISKGGSQILKISNGAYITGYLNATVFPVGNEIDVSWSSSDNYIYKASSSRASKMNIRELDIDSSKLYDLELKSFDFRKSNMDTGGFLDEPGQASFGMIAEDVFPIMPNLVNLNKDGEPEAIQYKLLSVLLLAELKKLRTRIEVLEGNG